LIQGKLSFSNLRFY